MQFPKYFLAMVIGFFIGALVTKSQTPSTQPERTICPPCEFNVTARLESIPDPNLFKKAKVKVSIYFNGLYGISGILDDNNNGHFVGSYKGSSAIANCSGANLNSLVCHVDAEGRTRIIDFGKEK